MHLIPKQSRIFDDICKICNLTLIDFRQLAYDIPTEFKAKFNVNEELKVVEEILFQTY